MHFVATFFLSCCKLQRSRSIFVLAIAEVFKNQGNEEYGKRDFVNAIHFYTEGIKVACKDKKLNAKLYSNRAIAHFYLGKNVCISFGILEMSRACILITTRRNRVKICSQIDGKLKTSLDAL